MESTLTVLKRELEKNEDKDVIIFLIKDENLKIEDIVNISKEVIKEGSIGVKDLREKHGDKPVSSFLRGLKYLNELPMKDLEVIGIDLKRAIFGVTLEKNPIGMGQRRKILSISKDYEKYLATIACNGGYVVILRIPGAT